MSLFENHVGVSVSLNKIRLVELVYSDDEFFLENVDEENFEESLSGLFYNENFFNILQNTFQKLISRLSIKSRNISFSLDPEFFQVFEVPFDNTLLKKDLSDHLRWELQKLKPMLNADEYLIQNIELRKVENSTFNKTVVLALDKKYFHSIIQLANKNQLTLKFVDYSHTASDNLLRFIKSLKGLSGLSVYKSNKSYSFIVLDDLVPVFVSKKNISDNDVSLVDIKKRVNELLSSRSGLRSFLYSFITGNGVSPNEIEHINKLFDLNFNLLNPFSVIKTSPNFSSQVDIQENPSEFSSAVGIALRLF